MVREIATKWELRRNPDYAKSAELRGVPLQAHEGYPRDNDGAWIIVGSDGNRVAVASFKGTAKRGNAWNAPDPEGQANAQLIAAAPELLAALEGIRKAFDAAHNHNQAVAQDIASAVIRKARGEENR